MSQFKHDTSMEACSCPETSEYPRECAASDGPCSAVSRGPAVCTQPARKLHKSWSNVATYYNWKYPEVKLCRVCTSCHAYPVFILPLSCSGEENSKTQFKMFQVATCRHFGNVPSFSVPLKRQHECLCEQKLWWIVVRRGGFSFRWSWCADRHASDVYRLQSFTKNVLGRGFQ